MRYGPAYRRARMQGRSNVFPGHAFDRHNGTPTIKLRPRTLGILEISFNNELNIVAILRAYFLLKNKLLNVGVHPYASEGIERFFSINSKPGLAYPFEERSSWGLRQHSGVSTRFRCGSVPGFQNYKLNKMGFSLYEEEEARLATRMNLRNNERSTRGSQKRSQETQKHAPGREKWRKSLFMQSVAGKTSANHARTLIYNKKSTFKIQRKGVDGARRSRGFTLFQHGAPSCRMIALVMSTVDNSSSPQDKRAPDTLFHIKPDFLVEYVALLVGLGFPHLSRSRKLLDTSDFTQYIDRHSKPARPVRSQSFISFSLRSGSLVL
ncbi:hypothetical protein ALC56_03235 [Trachymyrmex septentrionalis]|uniref:Uncharacterized protein n=1 Tax=Trachymyrmex septentrionalis TaxID=34720 RepID=A0A195FP55_9HYME|nr:hypothetical protein ALC56_03235 [Trachymyrmex septentrionalis]